MKLNANQKSMLLKAKILLVDLEISPMLAYTYNYYEGNVLKIVEPQKLLCFSYKWLGESGAPKTITLLDEDKNGTSDGPVTARLWGLLNECNYAVGHNINKFDAKMANLFFVEHSMSPVSPYKTIDTLVVARQKFKFPSNKLDELGKFLKVGQKTEITCGDLWEQCLNNDKKSYELMAKYCQQDVHLLEEVYWKLMPFAQGPLFNKMVNAEMVCPVCGSTDFHKDQRFVPDATLSTSWIYRCEKCGHFSKVPLTKDEREELALLKPLNRNISGCF